MLIPLNPRAAETCNPVFLYTKCLIIFYAWHFMKRDERHWFWSYLSDYPMGKSGSWILGYKLLALGCVLGVLELQFTFRYLTYNAEYVWYAVLLLLMPPKIIGKISYDCASFCSFCIYAFSLLKINYTLHSSNIWCSCEMTS